MYASPARPGQQRQEISKAVGKHQSTPTSSASTTTASMEMNTPSSQSPSPLPSSTSTPSRPDRPSFHHHMQHGHQMRYASAAGAPRNSTSTGNGTSEYVKPAAGTTTTAAAAATTKTTTNGNVNHQLPSSIPSLSSSLQQQHQNAPHRMISNNYNNTTDGAGRSSFVNNGNNNDINNASNSTGNRNNPVSIMSRSPRYNRVKAIPRHTSPSTGAMGSPCDSASASATHQQPVPVSLVTTTKAVEAMATPSSRWEVDRIGGTAGVNLIDAAAEEAEGEEKKDHDDFDCNDVLNYDDDYTDDINSTDDFFGKGNDGQGESQDQGVVKNDYGDDHADDESWRQHGKKFRASLVLNDEEHGGNSFTLSNSCSIERYYRVADRVMEQFMDSNIGEPDEMIESFLVGNRLFKFLSVVLPTHNEYFSTDPTLVAMRFKSQDQLAELLEYMEELELIIDEVEYNKYIISDLVTQKHDETASTANDTTTSSSAHQGFYSGSDQPATFAVQEESMNKPSKKKELTFSLPPSNDLQDGYNLSRGGDRPASTNVQNFNSLQGKRSLLDISNNSIVATHITTENSISQRSSTYRRQRFEEKVAAVVTATSDNSGVVDVHSRNEIRSSLRTTKIPSSKVNQAITASLPDPEESRQGDSQQNGTESSWANFSSADIRNDDLFETPKSRIDLLLDDKQGASAQTMKKKQPSTSRATMKLDAPKIRLPREALPRNLRAGHASYYSSSMDYMMDDGSSMDPPFISVAAGDVLNYSLDDSITAEQPHLPKTKIEERLEQASLLKNSKSTSSDPNGAVNHQNSREEIEEDPPSRKCFTISGGGGSGERYKYQTDRVDVDELYYNERSIGLFRGCVKSLIS